MSNDLETMMFSGRGLPQSNSMNHNTVVKIVVALESIKSFMSIFIRMQYKTNGKTSLGKDTLINEDHYLIDHR